MSNLIKKSKKLILGDRECIMYFDMKSVEIFQELSGMSFLNAINLINKYDDKAILYFMSASIRDIKNETAPLGVKLFEYDLIGLLLAHTIDVITLVASSMPQVENDKKKVQVQKKKKMKK